MDWQRGQKNGKASTTPIVVVQWNHTTAVIDVGQNHLPNLESCLGGRLVWKGTVSRSTPLSSETAESNYQVHPDGNEMENGK